MIGYPFYYNGLIPATRYACKDLSRTSQPTTS